MNKSLAVLQLLGAVILYAIALATLLNMVFISTRPETISVVNAYIGLGVLCICSLALGRIQWRKGLTRLKAPTAPDEIGPGM